MASISAVSARRVIECLDALIPDEPFEPPTRQTPGTVFGWVVVSARALEIGGRCPLHRTLTSETVIHSRLV